MTRIFLLAALGAVWLAGAARAETGSDPDWPCIQRKQPSLSLGQVWAGPVPTEAVEALAHEPAITHLAAALEQRRLSVEDASHQIADFAKTATDEQLTALMVAVLDRVNTNRSALIEGIGRYGHKQVALASQIEERRARMAKMEAAETPDFDAIDTEEKALDWDTRIFTDRQQSLSYVCETPVLLEQRAFAISRAISSQLKG